MTNEIVDVVAPASGSSPKETLKAIDFIKSIGLIPRISDDIHCSKEFFISNNDQYRLNDFKKALCSKDSRLIWCLRGGYGSARIMNDLTKLTKPTDPKLLIGFSDITNIHILFNQFWNLATLHAPVLVQLGAKIVDNKSVDLLKEVIVNKKKYIQYNNLIPLTSQAKRIKLIEGNIVGGNLSIIQTTVGTNWQINTDNKILFLEDVGVRGYALDRTLTHLMHTSIFKNAKAIILGDITGKKEKNSEIITDHVIEEFINKFDKPIFKLKGIGHEKTNNPLFLGCSCVISKFQNDFQIKVEIK